ncbi:Protein NLRC3 [Pelomyxa schiedti]|nr:Protein NLRC3 [Pelomyxa schiedti]
MPFPGDLPSLSVLDTRLIVIDLEMIACPLILQPILEGYDGFDFGNQGTTRPNYLQWIINKLSHFPHISALVIAACKVLTDLCRSPSNKKTICTSRGHLIVLKALEKQTAKSVEACVCACTLLQSLAEDSVSRNQILSNGGVKCVLDSMKSFMTDAQLQEVSFATLATLAANDKNILDISAAKLISEVIASGVPVNKLDLTGHSFGDLGTQVITQALHLNTQISDVNLSGTRNLSLGSLPGLSPTTKVGDCGASDIAELLKATPSIRKLNLSCNAIGEQGASALANCLKQSTSLIELDLSYNTLSDAGAQALSRGLKYNTTLTALNLSGNNIHDAGIKAISRAIKSNKTVMYLKLSDNFIDSSGLTLAKALRRNKTITHISLDGTGIGVLWSDSIGETLQVNTSILEINLAKTKISDAGVLPIALALKSSTSLTALNLSENQISSTGAMAIAEALQVNSSLKELDLSMNKVSDLGANAFAKALRRNRSLTTINLNQTQIPDSGAQSIAEALKNNSTLTKVNLNDNHFGDLGKCAIAAALALNTSVTYPPCHLGERGNSGASMVADILRTSSLSELDLSNNEYNADDMKLICDSLRSNSCLKKLDLRGNYLQDNGARLIYELLQENFTISHINLAGNDISPGCAQWITESCRMVSIQVDLERAKSFEDPSECRRVPPGASPQSSSPFENNVAARLLCDVAHQNDFSNTPLGQLSIQSDSNSKKSTCSPDTRKKNSDSSVRDLSRFYPPQWQAPTLLQAVVQAGVPRAEEVVETCVAFAAKVPTEVIDQGLFLTTEDVATIALYTYDFGPEMECYNPQYLLNLSLTEKTEKTLSSTCGLLQLLLTSLRKLPRVAESLLYRATKESASVFNVGDEIRWDPFTSVHRDICTPKRSLGDPTKGYSGTLFIIRNCWGYDLEKFSFTHGLQEILVEPGIEFTIENVLQTSFTVIELATKKKFPLILESITTAPGIPYSFVNEIAKQDAKSLSFVIRQLQQFPHVSLLVVHSYRSFICSYGGDLAVLQALRQQLDVSQEALTSACTVLKALSEDSASRRRIVHAGSIECLLAAIKSQALNTDTQQLVFSTLFLMCMENGDLDGGPLASAIESSSVTEISFYSTVHGTISQDAAFSISEALENSVSIHKISFADSLQIEKAGIELLGQVIKRSPTITDLCFIGFTIFEEMAPHLQHNHTIKTVRLKNDQAESNSFPSATVVCELLESTQIEELAIQGLTAQGEFQFSFSYSSASAAAASKSKTGDTRSNRMRLIH